MPGPKAPPHGLQVTLHLTLPAPPPPGLYKPWALICEPELNLQNVWGQCAYLYTFNSHWGQDYLWKPYPLSHHPLC